MHRPLLRIIMEGDLLPKPWWENVFCTLNCFGKLGFSWDKLFQTSGVCLQPGCFRRAFCILDRGLVTPVSSREA